MKKQFPAEYQGIKGLVGLVVSRSISEIGNKWEARIGIDLCAPNGTPMKSEIVSGVGETPDEALHAAETTLEMAYPEAAENP